MIGNVVLEIVIGAIPILGDIFDATFKANMRNLRLMERYAAAPRSVQTSSAGLVAVVLVILLGAALALALVLVLVIRLIGSLLG